MPILSNEDRDYLKNEFKKMTHKVNIAFFSTEEEAMCEHCDNIRAIIDEIKELSNHLNFTEYNIEKNDELAKKYNVEMAPALVFTKHDNGNIKYYGVPSGYEFSSFIEDIMDLGTDNNELDEGIEETIKKIDKAVNILVFVTPTCPYCPGAVRTAHKFAMLNDHINAAMVEAYEFSAMADKHGVQGVPRVVINEKISFEGSLPQSEFAEKIMLALED